MATRADGALDFFAPGDEPDEPEDESRTWVQLGELSGNTIHEGLWPLDEKLAPNQGLRRLDSEGALVPTHERVRGQTSLLIQTSDERCA